MPETSHPHSQATPAAGAAAGSGCVLFLIDESNAMDARVAGGTKSKAGSIATALNSLLNQLTTEPAVDLAVVGYRAAGRGEPEIGPRWRGALAGREFVSSTRLAAAPLAVESRARKVPGSGGVGVARVESVPFPVWYVPELGGAASRAAAFEHCRDMVSTWLSAAGPNPKPPMIVSLVGELSAQDPSQDLRAAVGELHAPAGRPLVMHAHLGSSDRIPATLYPSSDTHLPPGPIRALFHEASVLPEPFCASLGRLHVTVNAGARGLIYNAKMVDLIRLLSLVKTYAQYQPPVGPGPSEAAAAAEASSETRVPQEDTVRVLPSHAPAPDKPAPDKPAPERQAKETPQAGAEAPGTSTDEAIGSQHSESSDTARKESSSRD